MTESATTATSATGTTATGTTAIGTTDPLVLDVRPVPKPQRHPLIFEELDRRAVGESVVVLNDHNPIPLRRQVEMIYGEQFAWDYLEEGPELFRLRFTRRAAAPEGWGRTGPAGEAAPAARNAANVPPPVRADMAALVRDAAHSGVQWSHESEDLDLTLLSWSGAQKGIDPHRNDEVDVVWIGVEGEGVVRVDGVAHDVRPGVALLIPKGSERSVERSSERFGYLSLHRRRRGLQLEMRVGGKTK